MVNIKNIIVSSSFHVASFTNKKEKNKMNFFNLFNIHIPNEDVVMIDKNTKQTTKWKTKIARFKKQRIIVLLRFRFEQLKKKVKSKFIISILLFKSVENNLNAKNARIQTLCKEKKCFKISVIFKYKNKTQIKYKKFIRFCVKIFDMKKTIYRDKLQQIQCAVAHLNRDPDAVGFGLEEASKSITGQKFSKGLLNELMPKNQQKFHMYGKYKNAKQLKNQTINEYIIYFKNIESNIVTFSEKQRIHFFFHELNQKIYIQLMYDIIFINFNVLCDKATQIESVKKKRPTRATNLKKNGEKSKASSNNIKHLHMIKTEIEIKITFKIKIKKMTTKAVKKKNIAPESDPQSRRLWARIWGEVNASKTFLKKKSNVTIVKNGNIMLMIVLNPTINNKKTSENNKNVFIFFVSFQQKNTRFSFNYKNDSKKKCFIHNNKNFDGFGNDYQLRFSAANQEAREPQKRIKGTLNIDSKGTAFMNVSTAGFGNKHDK